MSDHRYEDVSDIDLPSALRTASRENYDADDVLVMHAAAREIESLNAAFVTERDARENAERERDAALEALVRLVDAQNGPPLLGGSAEQFWCEAMEKARAVLGREPQ